MLRYADERWQLARGFRVSGFETANTFCSTLVDRYRHRLSAREAAKLEAELGYHDTFTDTAEILLVIRNPGSQVLAEMLRLDRCPLNIPYRRGYPAYKAHKGCHFLTARIPR